MLKWLRVGAFFAPLFVFIAAMFYLLFVEYYVLGWFYIFTALIHIALRRPSELRFNWHGRILMSLDQLYNVLLSPWHNLTLDPQFGLFGAEDETVSSVIGKQIKGGDKRGHWQFIEKVLRLVLEADKKGHSVSAIEEDEGY